MLFRSEKKPIVSNHRTIKLGKTINGKVDLNKKDDLKVKPGQIISGKISLNKK